MLQPQVPTAGCPAADDIGLAAPRQRHACGRNERHEPRNKVLMSQAAPEAQTKVPSGPSQATTSAGSPFRKQQLLGVVLGSAKPCGPTRAEPSELTLPCSALFTHQPPSGGKLAPGVLGPPYLQNLDTPSPHLADFQPLQGVGSAFL